MDLITGFVEIVDAADTLSDGGGAYVHNLGDALGHEAEPDARLASRVVVEQLAIHVLGRKARLRSRQGAEKSHQVTNVVRDQRVDRTVAIAADVVNPVLGIDLTWFGLRAQLRCVPGEISRNLFYVDEGSDRV